MLPSSWIAAGAGAGLGFAAVIVGLSAGAVAAEEIGATLTPEILQDIARVEAEIDLIEAQTLERLAAPPDNQVQQIELLGKSMLYDKQLSVLRNEACAFWSYARNRIHRTGFGTQSLDRNLPRLGAHALQ